MGQHSRAASLRDVSLSATTLRYRGLPYTVYNPSNNSQILKKTTLTMNSITYQWQFRNRPRRDVPGRRTAGRKHSECYEASRAHLELEYQGLKVKVFTPVVKAHEVMYNFYKYFSNCSFFGDFFWGGGVI